MMQWFGNYRSKILGDMYEGEPLGPDKLDMLWPLLVGGAIFAALDLGLGLSSPYRLIILAALLMPGAIWFGYLTFHTLKALRLWVARRNPQD
ncbi:MULTISPECIES: hypothetical protein [unclassified Sphingopyxis]|uniref:hypothetical protein n=1 Tax=unclassified Sphingopyxis TaxID=2614943 RepID=UPI00285994E9|nr:MULTISPECIES: hypothetical protein [unclassified Sphingopyxis]MDR7058777.1 hypothetical protein [Sphingopyxis sp. BE235]MDR7179037.1 hypothetical protein [Sphingopyxis sp. BE249]